MAKIFIPNKVVTDFSLPSIEDFKVADLMFGNILHLTWKPRTELDTYVILKNSLFHITVENSNEEFIDDGRHILNTEKIGYHVVGIDNDAGVITDEKIQFTSATEKVILSKGSAINLTVTDGNVITYIEDTDYTVEPFGFIKRTSNSTIPLNTDVFVSFNYAIGTDIESTFTEVFSPIAIRLIEEILSLLKEKEWSKFGLIWDDDELLVGIRQAVDDVNVRPFRTNFTLENAPQSFHALYRWGGLFFALLSKGTLEASKEFNYSDKGLSLSIERSSKYHSFMQVVKEEYIKQRDAVKKNFRPRSRTILHSPVLPKFIAFSPSLFRIRG